VAVARLLLQSGAAPTANIPHTGCVQLPDAAHTSEAWRPSAPHPAPPHPTVSIWSPLGLAAYYGHADMLSVLAAAGAGGGAGAVAGAGAGVGSDVSCRSWLWHGGHTGWYTPLQLAAWRGHESCIRQLLALGVGGGVNDVVAAMPITQLPPLVLAAQAGHTAAAAALLEAGADAMDSGGRPLLLSHLLPRELALAAVLLKHTPSTMLAEHAAAVRERSLLIAVNGDVPMLKLLRDGGVSLDAVALVKAAVSSRQVVLLQSLLEWGMGATFAAGGPHCREGSKLLQLAVLPSHRDKRDAFRQVAATLLDVVGVDIADPTLPPPLYVILSTRPDDVDAALFDRLCAAGASPHACSVGYTPLAAAAGHCDGSANGLRWLRRLVEGCGVDVNALVKLRDGETVGPALFCVLQNPRAMWGAVEYLVAHGAKWSLDGCPWTPMQALVAGNAHTVWVHKLVALLGSEQLYAGSPPPLMMSLGNPYDYMASALIAAGADPQLEVDSVVPLLHAVAAGHTNGLRGCLEAAAAAGRPVDLSHRYPSHHGATLLQVAARHLQYNIIRMLCDMGAEVDAQGESGHVLSAPALVVAASVERNAPQCVQALLEAGADVNVVWRAGGCTAVQAALRQSPPHLRLFAALMDAGADPSVWCVPHVDATYSHAAGAVAAPALQSASRVVHSIAMAALAACAQHGRHHVDSWQYRWHHLQDLHLDTVVALWWCVGTAEAWGRRRAAVLGLLWA